MSAPGINTSGISLQFRIIASCSYLILEIASLCINFLLLAAFIKTYYHIKSRVFFTVSWNLLACDLLCSFVQLVLVIPESFAGKELYPKGLIYFFGFIDTLGYRACFLFAFYLTVNRLAIFMFPRLNGLFFGSSEKVYRAYLCIWIFVFFYAVSINLTGCHQAVNVQELILYYECSDNRKIINIVSTKIRVFSVEILPALMLLIYLTIFLRLKLMTGSWMTCFRHKKTTAVNTLLYSKKEINFLIQSVMICGILQIQAIFFNSLQSFNFTGTILVVANLAQNWLSILMSTNHAIIILMFNEKIQSRALDIINSLFCESVKINR